MPDRILFVTGKLAHSSLQRTMDGISSEAFSYEIRPLGVSVAALISESILMRRLDAVDSFDMVMLPGLCAGNVERLSDHFGVNVVKGPKELKDLPEYFGAQSRKASLDHHSVLIFAEIVDAPNLPIDQIVELARTYQDSGADVIDLGCLPGQDFQHLEESVRELKHKGFKVSVDSLDDQELVRGGQAGADYLLSLSESSLWIADEVDSIPVVIPDADTGVESLYRSIDTLGERGRNFLADSILNPIHFGFVRSIVQYQELRLRYPEVPIMIGTGNITELTEADTIGMTALLAGIASELDASAILTTEVSGHARTAVAEADLARRIMYAAKQDSSLPQHYSDGLLALHEKKPFPTPAAEIRELAQMIKDPSFRIQVSDNGVHIFNRDGIWESTDPFELFPHLKVDNDGSHAFYLGVELTKAQIAWQLGKRYIQDRALNWGCLLRAEQDDDEYQTPRSTQQSNKETDAS
ncbi:MAG: DUF6513 domain-containing protein [Acidiferrobacterales bacterium]|nr:DUF6513 domain-containing protein [Acidiferrobacterales bacterium]